MINNGRKSYEFDAVLTALTSISHIGETHGINAKFHRVKFMMPDGEPELIPTVTGNSIRGQLRDAGMRHMLDALGIDNLPVSAFNFLFSGGSLEKTGAKTIDVKRARELETIIPLVGIFGGGVGNHIIPGRFKCGILIPVSDETRHLIPRNLQDGHLPSIWECLQTESYTRKDDAKDERLHYLMSGDDVAQTEQMMLLPADTPVEKTGVATQMRYFIETLSAGTQLYWHLYLEHVTAVQFEAFIAAIGAWAQNPILGGKSAIGHGRVQVDFTNWASIDPLNTEWHTQNLPAPNSYMEHLQANARIIREVLYGI